MLSGALPLGPLLHPPIRISFSRVPTPRPEGSAPAQTGPERARPSPGRGAATHLPGSDLSAAWGGARRGGGRDEGPRVQPQPNCGRRERRLWPAGRGEAEGGGQEGGGTRAAPRQEVFTRKPGAQRAREGKRCWGGTERPRQADRDRTGPEQQTGMRTGEQPPAGWAARAPGCTSRTSAFQSAEWACGGGSVRSHRDPGQDQQGRRRGKALLSGRPQTPPGQVRCWKAPRPRPRPGATWRPPDGPGRANVLAPEVGHLPPPVLAHLSLLSRPPRGQRRFCNICPHRQPCKCTASFHPKSETAACARRDPPPSG